MKKKFRSEFIYHLSLIGFFAIFSTTISKSPVLPLYVRALGGDEIIIGLISAFSPLAGILFSFPVGVMSDRIGRKRLLVVAGGIFLVCPLLYLAVSAPLWLIPIRFFHGMATAILGPVASAMIVEKYASAKGEKLGVYSSSTLVGRAMAPMLGGFILSRFAQPGVSLVGYKYVYSAAFVLAIPVFVLTLFLKDGDGGGAGVGARDIRNDLKYLFSNKRLVSTAAVEMAIYFAYGAFETYLPLYLTGLDIPAGEIGLIFSMQILAIALSKPLFGRLADRVDKRKQIVAGALVLGVSIGAMGYFQSMAAAVVLGLVFGLSLSFSTIATSAYAAEASSPGKLGSSLGALSAIMDIGQTVGPLLTGIAITYFSYRLGFALSLLLIVSMTAVFIGYNRSGRAGGVIDK